MKKIERIDLRTCALKTNPPPPVSVEAEYKVIWAAAVGEELERRREPTNLVRYAYGPLFF